MASAMPSGSGGTGAGPSTSRGMQRASLRARLSRRRWRQCRWTSLRGLCLTTSVRSRLRLGGNAWQEQCGLEGASCIAGLGRCWSQKDCGGDCKECCIFSVTKITPSQFSDRTSDLGCSIVRSDAGVPDPGFVLWGLAARVVDLPGVGNPIQPVPKLGLSPARNPQIGNLLLTSDNSEHLWHLPPQLRRSSPTRRRSPRRVRHQPKTSTAGGCTTHSMQPTMTAITVIPQQRLHRMMNLRC